MGTTPLQHPWLSRSHHLWWRNESSSNLQFLLFRAYWSGGVWSHYNPVLWFTPTVHFREKFVQRGPLAQEYLSMLTNQLWQAVQLTLAENRSVLFTGGFWTIHPVYYNSQTYDLKGWPQSCAGVHSEWNQEENENKANKSKQDCGVWWRKRRWWGIYCSENIEKKQESTSCSMCWIWTRMDGVWSHSFISPGTFS